MCLCVFSIALTERLGVIFKIGVCFGSPSVGPEAQDKTAVLDEGQVWLQLAVMRMSWTMRG